MKVLAIEPQPDIYGRLVFNLRLNAFASVKAVACAVADKEGELTLFVDSGNRGESSVKVMSGSSSAESIKVPAKRLLTLIEEEGYDHVDVAKLDTEGAEDIILETFFAEAPRAVWPQALIMERGNNRWHVDLPALLAQNGYRAVRETKNNVIYERPAEVVASHLLEGLADHALGDARVADHEESPLGLAADGPTPSISQASMLSRPT